MSESILSLLSVPLLMVMVAILIKAILLGRDAREEEFVQRQRVPSRTPSAKNRQSPLS